MVILARRFLAVFFVLFLSCSDLFAQDNAELLMFERAGCPWCVRWDREVAPIYPKTALGQHLPLRKINLDRDNMTPGQLDLPIRFTPTFVLMNEGREVGRIVGYMNDATFWGLLEQMAQKTVIRSRASSTSEPAP